MLPRIKACHSPDNIITIDFDDFTPESPSVLFNNQGKASGNILDLSRYFKKRECVHNRSVYIRWVVLIAGLQPLVVLYPSLTFNPPITAYDRYSHKSLSHFPSHQVLPVVFW